MKVITEKFQVSFPNVFQPNSESGNYSLTMLFDNKEAVKNLEELAKNTAQEKWGDKVTKKQLQWPIKDGNEKDLEKYPNFENKVFANAKSKFQCGLVDQNRNDILDESEFYAGCFARASISAYAWEYKGKKGVSFNLNNVQKLADGERIGGRVDASSEFDAVETNDSDDDWGEEI